MYFLDDCCRLIFTQNKIFKLAGMVLSWFGSTTWRPSSSSVLTAQHQCTSPTASITRLMLARGGVCVPARQQRWLFQWVVAAQSGISLSQSLLPARGTVYRHLSQRRRHCLLSKFERHWRTCLRPRTDGAADPLVSFSVYRTLPSFLCVTCPFSFWTKCHVNPFVNNNNNIQWMSVAICA